MSEEKTEERSLQTIVNESGLEPTKAQVLLENFSNYFEIAAEWERKAKMLTVTDESQWAEMKMAREGRLFLRKKRLAVEKTRKKLKEQSLRESRAIDGIANVLKSLIVPIEEHLDAQEHFIDNKRKAEEEARQLEAEKLLREKEEKERLEKEAEERRIREENEKLRQEAEEREAKAKKEREAQEKKLAKEMAEAEAKLRAEREARERELAAERAAAEAREKELKAKAERERKAQQRKDEAKAKKAAQEYEKKLKAERLKASMVTCPECGHEFSVGEDDE